MTTTYPTRWHIHPSVYHHYGITLLLEEYHRAINHLLFDTGMQLAYDGVDTRTDYPQTGERGTVKLTGYTYQIWVQPPKPTPLGTIPTSSGGHYVEDAASDAHIIVRWTQPHANHCEDRWRQINTLMHEIGHSRGLGIGEYYNLNVADTSGVEPLIHISPYRGSACPYWGNKPWVFRDPMASNLYGWPDDMPHSTDEAWLMANNRFCVLHRRMIQSGYRLFQRPTPVSIAHDIWEWAVTDGGLWIQNPVEHEAAEAIMLLDHRKEWVVSRFDLERASQLQADETETEVEEDAPQPPPWKPVTIDAPPMPGPIIPMPAPKPALQPGQFRVMLDKEQEIITIAPTVQGVRYVVQHSEDYAVWKDLTGDIARSDSMRFQFPMRAQKEFFRAYATLPGDVRTLTAPRRTDRPAWAPACDCGGRHGDS